ncbi:hypothetical protein ACFX2I_000048 [Malus domestica]
MMGKAPNWTGNFFDRERGQGLHPENPSDPGAIFRGSFLCRPIQHFIFRDQPNLEHFQQLDWLTCPDDSLQLMGFRKLSLLDITKITKTGPAVFNPLTDCLATWGVFLRWLPRAAFFNDLCGWFRKYLLGKLVKCLFSAADSCDELLKRCGEGNLDTLLDLLCSLNNHPESNFGTLDVSSTCFIHLPMHYYA